MTANAEETYGCGWYTYIMLLLITVGDPGSFSTPPNKPYPEIRQQPMTHKHASSQYMFVLAI